MSGHLATPNKEERHLALLCYPFVIVVIFYESKYFSPHPLYKKKKKKTKKLSLLFIVLNNPS